MAGDVTKESFEELSHTADTGIRARSASLSGVFEQSARGMFALILPDPPLIESTGRQTLSIEAPSGEELLHALLSELLFLHAVLRVLPVTYAVSAYSDVYGWHCTADIAYGDMTSAVQAQATEIKAVTWHGLTLRMDESEWIAEVIFDT
ncbi:archease [bacterium]|nr:archease [bacterium]